MKSVDLMYQTMLAELGQRSLDADEAADPDLCGMRFRMMRATELNS